MSDQEWAEAMAEVEQLRQVDDPIARAVIGLYDAAENFYSAIENYQVNEPFFSRSAELTLLMKRVWEYHLENTTLNGNTTQLFWRMQLPASLQFVADLEMRVDDGAYGEL